MHAWEGNPRLDESSKYRSQELLPEGERAKPARQPDISWRVVAVFAGGSLLGVPFVASGTAHAAWTQLSHMFAFFRR
jgi:hypothetical protein